MNSAEYRFPFPLIGFVLPSGRTKLTPLSRFRGSLHGDVDVLAWNKKTGMAWAIECKRRLLDRTISEFGERLAEYTTMCTHHKKRTPIRKNLDRVDFLRANLSTVASITKIPVEDIKLKAALATDNIVPVQFTKTMSTRVDRTCTFRDLAKPFGLS
ncbi:hypothetical protein [Xanthobacter variabilis]|uniref:hypothetical protein n=1 Tax=Xanthobacter variabilis TaxID=3119932 RepID=UPI0037276D19